MRFDPEQSAVDWDGLWTMVLSCLVIILTAAIPLFFTYIHILRTARNSPDSTPAYNSCFLFGKKLVGGEVDSDYACRLTKVYQLVQEQPDRLVLLLGGKTSSATISEAASGLRYLQQQGLPEVHNIRLEEQSKNTLDNLQNARKLLQQEQIKRVTLISNRYHLARCRLIADSLKIEHALCAAEATLQISPTILLKLLIEGVYMHWFVVGKQWAWITGNKRMLQRVT